MSRNLSTVEHLIYFAFCSAESRDSLKKMLIDYGTAHLKISTKELNERASNGMSHKFMFLISFQ